MKKFFLILPFIFFIFTSTFAVSYNSDPKIFIGELVGDVIKILNDKDTDKKTKAEQIKKIAIVNVDIKAMGMYTLGDIRKTLDAETISNYNKLFEKYFLKSLTSRLTDYSTTKFKVINADKKSPAYTIVNSKIEEDGDKPEIKIDWRVYTKDPLKPLIRDLIVEGLSLARTQKEEFASILSSNNNEIKFLLNKLEEFINN